MSSLTGRVESLKSIFPIFIDSLLDALNDFSFEILLIIIIVLLLFIFVFNISEALKLFLAGYFHDRKQRQRVDSKSLSVKRGFLGGLKSVFSNFIRGLFDTRKYYNTDESYQIIKVGFYDIQIKRSIFLAFRMLILNLIILLSVSFLVKTMFYHYPNYEAVYPMEDQIWDDYSKPVEVVFDTAINKNDIDINMSPETKGKWVFPRCLSFLPFSRRAKFYPEETIMPGEKILIYINGLSNPFNTYKGGEHLITFRSVGLPQIESTIPEDRARKVSIEDDIVLNLSHKDGYYVDWKFEFDKEVDFTVIRDNSKQIRLALNKNLIQGKKYKLDIYQTPVTTNLENSEILRKGEEEIIRTIRFQTVTPPLIASFSPTGSGVIPKQEVRVIFDQGMNRDSVESAFSIDPQINGEFKWEDEKTLTFIHEGLEKETSYEVRLGKGLKSVLGGKTEGELVFSFETVGKVAVSSWIPADNVSGISIATSINIKFNQEVDKKSAESKFSISPSVPGNFSWSGNTMVFDPANDLDYVSSYNITIASGVKSVHGIDSVSSFSASFTTEYETVILDVPQLYQEHAFTCNLTAAAMLISFKGISSGEMNVYNEIPKDNTDCKKEGDDIIEWGNPHSGYVGDIDGNSYCGGYGIYWRAISSYFTTKGISNKVFSGWSVSGLAKEIEAGHPALIWGQNGLADPYDKSWSTPDGQYIYAINGMHSEVAVGFMGPSDNPTHIITNDPWRGRRVLTIDQFLGYTGCQGCSNWSYFNNTAVVVY